MKNLDYQSMLKSEQPCDHEWEFVPWRGDNVFGTRVVCSKCKKKSSKHVLEPVLPKNEKIELSQLISPSDWILAKAKETEKMWEDMTKEDRQDSMIAAIIAYLETERKRD